jgi:ABC-type Na+ transport system ATPase subunit NatA
MGRIVLEHVSKEFPGGVQAVRDVSLEIGDGEFMSWSARRAAARPPSCA